MKRSPGFTLVELMVACVILAALGITVINDIGRPIATFAATMLAFTIVAKLGASLGWGKYFPHGALIAGVVVGFGACGVHYARLTEDPRTDIGRLMALSRDSDTKGNLTILRNAIEEFRKDEKSPPTDLETLLKSARYLGSMARANPRDHKPSAAVRYAASADDAGGWLYVNVKGDPRFGTVWVNCTHTDRRGTLWTAY